MSEKVIFKNLKDPGNPCQGDLQVGVNGLIHSSVVLYLLAVGDLTHRMHEMEICAGMIWLEALWLHMACWPPRGKMSCEDCVCSRFI